MKFQTLFQHKLPISKKFLAIGVGIMFFGGAIFLTYQYMSRQSRADVAVVNYLFKAGSCETNAAKSECEIRNKKNDTVSFDVVLTSSMKMSGADFIFAYNIGKKGHLRFQGHTSVAFPEKILVETHPAETDGADLLHIAIVNQGTDDKLAKTDTIRLTFVAEKEGSSNVALITSASTIVGPEFQGVYSLLPQNNIGSTGSENSMQNIFHVRVVTTGTGSTPTPGAGTGTPGAGSGTPGAGTGTPGAGTGTPGAGSGTPGAGTGTPGAGSGTPGAGTGTPGPTGVDLKDIKVNFRLRLQGITTQPRNASPIQVQVKLLEGTKVLKTDQVTFTPQGDGVYVGDQAYKSININAKHAFQIKGPKHLQKRICVLDPSEQLGGTYNCDSAAIVFKEGGNTLDASKIVLLAGDTPLQNGLIDAVDIAFVRNNVGSTDAEVVARGDLNYDTIVDTQDYALIMGALSFKYDE